MNSGPQKRIFQPAVLSDPAGKRQPPLFRSWQEVVLVAVVDGNMEPDHLLKELGEKAKERVLKNFDKIRRPHYRLFMQNGKRLKSYWFKSSSFVTQ